MKIIALYPLLREELNFRFLEISILSLYRIVDEILIAVDYPNEHLKLNFSFLKKKKIRVFYLKKKLESNRVTSTPRVELLKMGRKRKGTHFIWLDSDEVFTYPFLISGRRLISQMKMGQKIHMHWMSMWKNFRWYRNDKKSVWSNIYKDFIVCDSSDYKLITDVFHEPRTQGPNNKENRIVLPAKKGAVMHLQFVNWNNFKLKQAWWMCQEIARIGEKPSYINRRYFYAYFENFSILKKINKQWIKHIPEKYVRRLDIDTSSYWMQRFRFFFKKESIHKFEQLNIWHISELNDLFFEIEGRRPSLNLMSKLNICLFFILENFRLIKRNIINL
jgi:hypothetical protein